MSLAAGFVCADGIVLVRTTEHSGSTPQWTPTAIFQRSAAAYEVALTGTGDASLVRMAADHLLERELDDDDGLDEVWKKSERVANRLAKKYIFCHGERDTEKPRLQLLVAVRAREGSRLLLRSEANRLAKSDGCEFVGVGQELARSVASWLYEPPLTVSVVSQLAAHIIHWTAEHAPACGRALQVLSLTGTAQPAPPQQIPLEGECFWGLHRLLQPILTGVLDERLSDVQFDDRLRWFEERMVAVRQACGDERRRESDSGGVAQKQS